MLIVERAAEFADALLASGALAVTIEDADAAGALEQARYGEPGGEAVEPGWRSNRLSVLIDDAAVDDALDAASRALGIAPPPIQSTARVDQIDWVRSSQAQFQPIEISERLWIVPSWHQVPVAGAVAIRLDPGAAFGTGAHPTTQLCLRWLDRRLEPGASVLDYGCGSGVLAIAAAKLGAGRVVGTDIDPQALVTARANTAENTVDASYTDPDSLPAGTFDVVLANILANPLKLLAPAILARVASGGSLVLSGVLERQANELIDVYRTIDPALPLEVWAVDEGWACLAATRTARPSMTIR